MQRKNYMRFRKIQDDSYNKKTNWRGFFLYIINLKCKITIYLKRVDSTYYQNKNNYLKKININYYYLIKIFKFIYK